VNTVVEQLYRAYSRYIRDTVPGVLALALVAAVVGVDPAALASTAGEYYRSLPADTQKEIVSLLSTVVSVGALSLLLLAPVFGLAVEVLSRMLLDGPLWGLEALIDRCCGDWLGGVLTDQRPQDLRATRVALEIRWPELQGCSVQRLATVAEAWLLAKSPPAAAAIDRLYDSVAVMRSLALLALGAAIAAAVRAWSLAAVGALVLAGVLLVGASVSRWYRHYYALTMCYAAAHARASALLYGGSR